MRCLYELIADRPPDALLLVHGDRQLTATQVLDEVQGIRSSSICRKGQMCFIACANELEAILTMIAADGWSRRVVLGNDSNLSTDSGDASPLTRWHLPTSGSTGKPKWVAHNLASLARTVKANAEVGATVRWGLLYNPLRFAGLQVVLQALIGGSILVVPADRSDLTTTIAEFESHQVNALSATPSFWRKLLLAGLVDDLNLQFISMGGEIADEVLLATLKEKHPRARITHIYASTEAGVGFAVSDGQAGFPATFLENPPQGVQLKVDTHGQLLVRPGDSTTSYVDGSRLTDGEGWIATSDLVERRGSRYCFLGRANHVINVGGNKVHPREIEAVALGVPGVALARVQAKQSPIVGQVPELIVEPDFSADRPALQDQILERCRAELPREKWPARVVFVDKLPLSEAGKNVSTEMNRAVHGD